MCSKDDIDAISTNADQLGDGVDARAFLEQTQHMLLVDGLLRPAVNLTVPSPCRELQIAQPEVEPILVSVMNDLAFAELATELLLHGEAVLEVGDASDAFGRVENGGRHAAVP